MKKYKWPIILLNLIALLVFFNFSVYSKEKTLEDGKLIYLKLAPVDPRSLMQGDYMTLNYDISSNFNSSTDEKRGYCIVKLDALNNAEFIRLQPNKTPLNKGEYLIKYYQTEFGNISLGAESYFFQEGKADVFEDAVAGGIKVDNQGNSILIGLYDKNLKLLK